MSIQNDPEEIWKEVFENYEISNLGRFRRAKDGIKSGRTHIGKVLSLTLYHTGYVAARPIIGGKIGKHYVHVLVAATFIGPKPDGMQVNHKNGIKSDNRVCNLEYVTRSDNVKHAYESGISKGSKARTTQQQIDSIREMHRSGVSFASMSKLTGVSAIHCSRIANGKSHAND